jgi:hypothetical protein
VADRPLSSATRRRLGGPSPRQLADRIWTPPRTRLLSLPESCATSQDHPVLATVSSGYPRFQGRLSIHYSPVRHSTRPVAQPFAFDLHASSTPPPFALSQDQTLQKKSSLPWRSPACRSSCPEGLQAGRYDSNPVARIEVDHSSLKGKLSTCQRSTCARKAPPGDRRPGHPRSADSAERGAPF